MCHLCFTEHWEGRDAQEFLDALPKARREAVDAAVSALRAYPGVTYRDGEPTGVTGPMHACVEDENYDLKAMRRNPEDGHPIYQDDEFWAPFENPETERASDTWDALSEDERSLVCALFWNYRLSEPPEESEPRRWRWGRK